MRANALVDEAPAMSAYMRNKFVFMGLKRPMRQALVKEHLPEIATKESDLWDAVHKLWEEDEREYQYAALDLLQWQLKHLRVDLLPLLKDLLISKPWWDTVDRLASAVIGPLVKHHPQGQEEVFACKDANHLWLERTAILFQLKYKGSTRIDMLKEVVIQFADSEEFFHQKAIGWALRTYSRIDPVWVASLLNSIQLSSLSRREASKYL